MHNIKYAIAERAANKEAIIMGFSIEPELPVQEQSSGNTGGGNGGSRSNIDYNAENEYRASVLGVKKSSLIGTIVALYDLGIQPRAEQVLEYDSKVEKDQGWRLEVWEDSGTPKCEGARLEKQVRKGVEVTVLKYPQVPVAQLGVVVDFPEKMLNLDQFYSPEKDAVERPFRDIIGATGWGGRKEVEGEWINVLAKPFNLVHTNVNRNQKDAPKHMAFAKNSMLYDLADYCGVTDADGNFHIGDIAKLIGKSCMFDVDVSWNTWVKDGVDNKKLITKIVPATRVSERDESFLKDTLLPRIDEGSYGVVQMKGASSPQVLKEARKVVWDTISFATNYEGSPLQAEKAAADNEWRNNVNNTEAVKVPDAEEKGEAKGIDFKAKEKAAAQKVAPVVEAAAPDNFDGFDADVPF